MGLACLALDVQPVRAQSLLPAGPAPWVPIAPDPAAAGWEPVSDVATLPAEFLPLPANRNPSELAIVPREGKPI